MKRLFIHLSSSKKNHLVSVLLLIVTAVLWSAGGVLIKSIAWNPIAIAGSRSAIAALLILAVIRRPRCKLSWPLVIGSLAYAGTVISFVAATKMTTAANAILLQYTAPIYVALFGVWILKEKASIMDWVSIVFVLGGMVLFFMDSLKAGNMLGNFIAVLSGLCFAFMILFLRKQKDGYPLDVVFWGNLITAVISIPFMVGGLPDSKSIIGIVLLGVFQMGLAYILYTYAIKKVTAIEGVLIPIIEALLNPVWVMIFIGERPSVWAIVGGFVVIASIAVTSVLKIVSVEKEEVLSKKPELEV